MIVEADCALSIEYFPEFLNHVYQNWEVLARENYINNLSNSILIIICICFSWKDFLTFGYVI